MKNHQNFRDLSVITLFFVVIFIVSYFLTTPTIKQQTEEEKVQLVKDSLMSEYYKKQLDSFFPFEHSKIK